MFEELESKVRVNMVKHIIGMYTILKELIKNN